MILQRRSSGELKAEVREDMLTMHHDALLKAAAGVTSLEEIFRVSSGDVEAKNGV